MKAFLIPPTESDQKDTDLKAVGVKSMKIGEILNMGRESVAITGAYKSDSHHLLHMKAPTLFEHKSPSGRCFMLQSAGDRAALNRTKKEIV